MPAAYPITEHTYDVVVVGTGGAGLRATLGTTLEGLKTACISKVFPTRSHTVSAQGGIAAALGNMSDDDWRWHMYDTVKGSDWLGDQDAIEYMCRQAIPAVIELEHFGVPFSRTEAGEIYQRPFGGHMMEYGDGAPANRACAAADRTGHAILHALYQQSLRHNAEFFVEYFALDLIMDDEGVCRGVMAWNLEDGSIHRFRAHMVILATGGLGRVYAFTTNGNICTGDGMALAYRAGVGLKDMEMVQFHPTGLPFTGILITEAVRGEGGYLLNNEGERFLKRYVPNKMELGPRDIISRAMMTEFEEGHGFEGPHGKYLHLDVRHLGEDVIDRKLPFMRELGREFVGIDIVKDPIPVRPVQHYMMGGIDADISGATPMAGLYAAGECANVGLNGANRLGSNSLPECLVFGAAAGRAAAEYASSAKPVTANPVDAILWDEARRVEVAYLEKKGGDERIGAIREEMQHEMDTGAGVFRTKEGLETLVERLGGLRQRFSRIKIEDSSRTFNTELTSAIELDFMLELSQTIALTALARDESRGAHARRDFPERNDEKYLKHSLVFHRDAGKPRLEYRDVRVGNFKPQARTY